jgi:hypothetical protein
MSQSCVWFFGLDPLWWYLVFPNPGVGLFCALLTCITPILIWRQHIWYCHSCTISLSWVYCHRCTISSFECIVWGSMIHGWHDSEVRTLHLSNCVSLLPHKDSFLTYLNSIGFHFWWYDCCNLLVPLEQVGNHVCSLTLCLNLYQVCCWQPYIDVMAVFIISKVKSFEKSNTTSRNIVNMFDFALWIPLKPSPSHCPQKCLRKRMVKTCLGQLIDSAMCWIFSLEYPIKIRQGHYD